MTPVREVLALISVSIAMALALAHALEFPGKLRLSRQDYETVQEIYYPGFSYGGASEGIGLLLLLILLLLAPGYGVAFWLIVAAFLALIIMHGVYWILIHPINRFWLKTSNSRALRRTFSASARTKAQAPCPIGRSCATDGNMRI